MMNDTGKGKTRESVIDENLKKVYDETLSEGVPDKFRDLLNALKQQDKDKGSSK